MHAYRWIGTDKELKALGYEVWKPHTTVKWFEKRGADQEMSCQFKSSSQMVLDLPGGYTQGQGKFQRLVVDFVKQRIESGGDFKERKITKEEIDEIISKTGIKFSKEEMASFETLTWPVAIMGDDYQIVNPADAIVKSIEVSKIKAKDEADITDKEFDFVCDWQCPFGFLEPLCLEIAELLATGKLVCEKFSVNKK